MSLHHQLNKVKIVLFYVISTLSCENSRYKTKTVLEYSILIMFNYLQILGFIWIFGTQLCVLTRGTFTDYFNLYVQY